MSVWQWLWLGVALFITFGLLAAWSDAERDCDGTVVRNFWGWPSCVEAGK